MTEETIRHKLLADKVRPEINKLAERRKLVRKCFQEFAHKVYPGAPPDQLREMRTAFFAGAAELHAMMIYGSQPGMETTDRDMAFMKGIVDELEDFHRRTVETASADTGTRQ